MQCSTGKVPHVTVKTIFGLKIGPLEMTSKMFRYHSKTHKEADSSFGGYYFDSLAGTC